MIVSRMNFVAAKTQRPVRLLGLSTAVANANDMASWLKVGNQGLFNFPSSVRPVPLEMYIDGFPDNMGFCPLMKSMNKPAYLAIKSHSPTKPVLIFVASRRQTRLTALDLIHLCGMEDDPRRFLRMDEDELQQVISLVKDDTLKLSLQFGIGLHHAGLVDSDRRISHELFASNKIQILIATSTLAWGVNLPAHLVIVKGTQFFDAKIEGYKDMDLTDVLQMMGRAGRPAFDTSGIAMVFTKESTKPFYKYFLNSGFPVESHLHKVLDDHLGAEITARTIKSRQEALDFLTWTFLFRRIHFNPTYYGIEDSTEEGINSWLVNLVDTAIENLDSSGCLNLYQDGRMLPTEFLKISSYYYMSHKTMRHFLKNMKPHALFKECLMWLCSAIEYDELPVRHNEDLVNIEMSKEMRYAGEEMNLVMWDPHVKAFLLIQAFMSHVDLPIADYIQDTWTVLDQSLRILQAAIDTIAVLGHLSTALTLIRLMQCIKQACWFDDDPISTLPGMRLKKLPEAHPSRANDSGMAPLRMEYFEGEDRLTTLEKLGYMKGDKLDGFMKRLNVPAASQKEFFKVVNALPVLTLDVAHTRGSQEFTVTLIHKNPGLSSDFKMYTPKFHKVQKESWFVILGDVEADEIIALSRSSPPVNAKGKRSNLELSFKASLTIDPSYVGRRAVLYCINDAVDLRYQVEVDL